MMRKLIIGAALAAGAMPALAQSPMGYGTIITLPVVVQSTTYGSSIFIHNPRPGTIHVNPYYIGANGSATVGLVGCPAVTINSGNTVQRSLTSLCALNAGSNFGRLVLYEGDATNEPFAAYSRVETFSGNGFSIEGFPIGNFSNSKTSAYVTGLKRQAGAPGYQSNCFLAALNEPVTVFWQLLDSTGALIGTSQNTPLAQNEMVRFLDVFNVVGAAAVDWSNVTARFAENGAGEPSFVAFCTVQNNTSFDADFRVAKTYQASGDDERLLFTSSASFSAGVTTDLAGNLLPTPSSGGVQHNWVTFMAHPDWVSCSVTGVTGTIEMRMLDPQGNVVAGGSDATSFPETYLGEKSTRNNGVNGLWKIQVGDATFSDPTAYTLTCTSGNGMSQLIYAGSSADDF